jgi:hypothetical protein
MSDHTILPQSENSMYMIYLDTDAIMKLIKKHMPHGILTFFLNFVYYILLIIGFCNIESKLYSYKLIYILVLMIFVELTYYFIKLFKFLIFLHKWQDTFVHKKEFYFLENHFVSNILFIINIPSNFILFHELFFAKEFIQEFRDSLLYCIILIFMIFNFLTYLIIMTTSCVIYCRDSSEYMTEVNRRMQPFYKDIPLVRNYVINNDDYQIIN